MRDEDFEYFISKFGEATKRSTVPVASFEKWRGRLPDQLLKYWQEEGWCEYADGLFCTADPDEYEDVLDEWLADTGLDEIDAFHVIARPGFGTLYVCGEKTGCSVTVRCALNMISALENDLKEETKEDQDFSIRFFFSYSEPFHFDMKDEHGQPLFKRARSKLGPLEPREIYGFEPAIVLGGKILLENLAKVNVNVHLTILRQFAEPELPLSGIDIEKLLDS
ncbi:hypothetical protein Hrubri_2798 [Herbaspirillum rubrisubalbicans M1]|uniref:GAD-like domain-containing protein n=1 Tax=Herbaspirillum rubrisubalbicans TaxID=80842 RepID=UPI00073A203B|nr:GAD-like domain-containing protein [Herbaspirillum rubrisubalbicans]ALU89974.1 hypothetical protein Hrubri_2798 [Herbaspirillum rubrisubalbicans M1]